MNKIEIKARQVIDNAGLHPIVLIGLPLEFVDIADLQSKPVVSNCSRCNASVLSSEIKEKILELTVKMNPPAKILCGKCLASFKDLFKKNYELRRYPKP